MLVKSSRLVIGCCRLVSAEPALGEKGVEDTVWAVDLRLAAGDSSRRAFEHGVWSRTAPSVGLTVVCGARNGVARVYVQQR